MEIQPATKQRIEEYLETAVDAISGIADLLDPQNTTVKFDSEETKIIVNGTVVYVSGKGPQRWKF